MSKTQLRSMILLAALSTVSAEAAEPAARGVALAIHGGIAGPKQELTAEHEKELRADLRAALAAGYAKLREAQGTALDAVETAVRLLEDSPHFNAGKGAVFTLEGRNELDAAIMDGKTRRAGAVASVTTIKNPISAARAVMEKSKHVLLVGAGADAFAAKAGLEIVDPKYFWTEPRWRQIQETWKKDKEQRDKGKQSQSALPKQPWSTVGAVALDTAGNLAAGTSTGGILNKMPGRVGDCPIIGAGTYADNATCAVSATGHGEFFIRFVVAYDISALVKYKDQPIEAAAAEVILHKLKQAGGNGGVIALDPRGNLAMPYNTQGMYRGYVTRDGQITVLLYEQ